MWLVTYTVNEYDQHGDYILVAWADKPDYLTFVNIITKIDSDFYNDRIAATQLFQAEEYGPDSRTGGEWKYLFRKFDNGEEIGGRK